MNNYGDNDSQGKSESGGMTFDANLLNWVTSKCKHARDVRDQKYARRWDEYTRLWRGFWKGEDKNTASERSKLITPALQQAIEMSVAEIEEAVFSRTAWFDIDDDMRDEMKDDAIAYRDQLLEDFELASVPESAAQVFLLGAIYGTGIGKLNVRENPELAVGPDGQPVESDEIQVTLDPVRPDEFLIDPSALKIDDALFCAHEFIRPLHTIQKKIDSGVYKEVAGGLRPYTGTRTGDSTGTDETTSVRVEDNGVLITEYHGKVPAKYLKGKKKDDEELVEAIITVVNESDILRAQATPFRMKDRAFIAYQHDTVPGEFWGRGVAEKGYNPQKALDAEVRARIDALALITAPMMGADMGRLPRNPDLRIRPGKILFTRGRPSEVLEPVGFNPQALALTFQQSGDMERMVQMATGSMDSATPIGMNGRNETMGGMSMMQTGFLKRSKRTMQNIERQFLQPLVRRSLWRYMQFDPERYPVDMKFLVRASMGIMAKEVEMSQLNQMLGYTPPESPAHAIILKAIFENTASSEKAELKAAMDAMSAPPSPEEQKMQQMMQQLQLAMQQATVQKEQAEAMKAQAEAILAQAKAKREMVLADLEDDKVEIAAANVAVQAEHARIDREYIDVDREKAKRPTAKK